MSYTTRGSCRPKKLSFNLNLVDLSISGFYFCRECQRVTEPDNCGEFNQVCCHCHSFRVKWCPPIFTAADFATNEKPRTAGDTL